MKPILCMGLMVCDVLASPVNPDVFEKDSSPLQNLSVLPGGDALNVATVLNRFGCETRILGCVGRDCFGDMLVSGLEAQGIDARFVVRREFATSTSIVLIPADGERHFAYYGKSNDSLCESDLTDEALAGASHLHFASVMALNGFAPDALARVMRRAREAGLTTSLDMTYKDCDDWLAQVEPALPYVDLFMPSLNEAERVFGTSDLHAMRLAAEKYGMRALVIKCGERGSFATDFKEEIMVPTFVQGPVVDATGAGDTFCGGFLRAFLGGMTLRESLAFASAGSAYCLSAVGATAGVPDDETVLAYARRIAEELNISLS